MRWARSLLAVLAAAALWVSLAPWAVAVPRPGSVCQRPGATVASTTWLLTCTKTSRGPVWKRTPLPLDYGVQVTPAAQLLPSEACAIEDVSMDGETWRSSSGVNRPAWTLPVTGPLKMLVLPVGFPDALFGSTDLSYVKGGYEYVDEFFTQASYGRSGLDVTFAPREKWVSLPTTAVSWNLDPGPYGEGNSTMSVDTWGLVRTALDAADESLRLGDYPVVAVVTPVSGVMKLANRTEAMPAFMYTTASGALVRGATFATANVSKESVAHELGHSWLGLEDFYGPIPRLGQVLDPEYPDGWFPRWDLMSDNTNMGAWTRILTGWLPWQRVRCASRTTPSTHALYSLESGGAGPRAVVVPISASRALVVEARATSRYTASYSKGPTVVVYEVDTVNNHHNGPLRLKGEVNRLSPVRAVTTATHTVTVERLSERGAIVKVMPRS